MGSGQLSIQILRQSQIVLKIQFRNLLLFGYTYVPNFCIPNCGGFMKSAIRGAIAVLMLLGLYAGVMPKNAKQNAPVMVAGGGPAPLCDPSDPHCRPPIPPAR